MSTHTELSRITIDIPSEQHKKIKTLAAVLGKTIREIVIESLEEHLSKIPNKETREAIEEARAGKNLVKATSLEDLFEKLGI